MILRDELAVVPEQEIWGLKFVIEACTPRYPSIRSYTHLTLLEWENFLTVQAPHKRCALGTNVFEWLVSLRNLCPMQSDPRWLCLVLPPSRQYTFSFFFSGHFWLSFFISLFLLKHASSLEIHPWDTKPWYLHFSESYATIWNASVALIIVVHFVQQRLYCWESTGKRGHTPRPSGRVFSRAHRMWESDSPTKIN